ncbi:TetR family transcriptional regulator [Conyzicola sp.]|uniref:TetR family transcriptional regulator n=1 Tax=Conyzicola sp. TaxID=1969404 RepID=UPI00398A047F
MIRREQAERTRDALLDAAAEEFWLHGLEGARIQDVLNRTAMTKGGLYHHFTNKVQMAEALVQLEDERWPEVVAGVERSGLRGLAALESFSLAVAERLNHDVRARAIVRIADELDPPAVSAFALWHDFAILALQQAIADGEVSDVIPIREVAQTVVECIYGASVSPAPLSRKAAVSDRLGALWMILGAGLRTTAR